MKSLIFSITFLLSVNVLSADQPNLVIIYGDDIGYGDFGCYGAKTIPTPNIDKLAENGIMYTSGYATSATCTPSRFSLLTGEYAWRKPGRGIAPPNGSALIKPGTPTLASMLGEAGYQTAVIGKWHLGLGEKPKPNWSGEIKPGPLEIGFQEAFILPTTNDRVPCVYVRGHHIVGHDTNDPVDVFDRNPDGQPTGVSERASLKMDWSHDHNNSIVNGISRIGFMVGGNDIRWVDEEMADVFLGETREFISKSSDKPFFLFYSAHQPHVPRAPNKRFVGATPHGPRGDAIVEFDWCVGQIVEALEQSGKLENTLIVVTSDNGPVLDDGYKDQARELIGDHKPAGPYDGGKYSLMEGGTRVPFVVGGGAITQGGKTGALISQVDMFASFASLAGVEEIALGKAMDSEDLSALLVDSTAKGRDHLVEHSGSGKKLALRQEEWKYIPAYPGNGKTKGMRNGNNKKAQLYDLKKDPGETKNLAKKKPDVVKRLDDLLKEEIDK